MQEIITEEEMSLELIQSLLAQNNIDSRGNGEALGVKLNGRLAIIRLLPSPLHKLVGIHCLLEFSPAISKARQMEWANVCTERNAMVRFSTIDDTHLYCEYHVLFDIAILTNTLILSIVRFGQIVDLLRIEGLAEGFLTGN